MADSTPKVSLSLLDLLFCAFGGVIVMAVVFISIAGEAPAPSAEKSGHIDVRLKNNEEYPEDISLAVYIDSMPYLSSYHLCSDSNYYYGAKFELYPYSNSYESSLKNMARLSFADYEQDTLFLKVKYHNSSNNLYNAENLEFEVARFVHGEWDTISVDCDWDISENSYESGKRIKIPLK